jgi:hypothetical protein
MAKTRRSSRKSKGRKGTRKGPSEWNKKVMAMYRKMKAGNPNTSLGDAMRAASKANK